MAINQKLRSKRVIIPAIAAVAIVGAGGATYALVGDDENPTADQRSEAGDAALAEVGGGRVLDVDLDDDTDEGGTRVYEVEVVDADGIEWDITLDEDFTVLVADRDDRGSSDGRDDDGDTGSGASGNGQSGQSGVDDDAPISDTERAEVTSAAEAAIEGGSVIDVDRSDDRGEAWEVEVRDADGIEWNVTLDADLSVIDTVRD